MPTSASDAVASRPTVEQEMAKFVGFSTTDGEVSDGKQTAKEAEALAANDKTAAAAGTETPPAVKLTDAESEAAVTAAQAVAGDTELTDEDKEKAVADALAKKTAEAAKAPKPKKSVDARIGELTRARRDAERRAAAAEGSNDELRRRLDDIERRVLTTGDKGGKQSAAADVSKAPDPKDFTYGELDSGYISALSRFEARQEFEAARKEVGEQNKTAAETRDAQVVREKMDAQFEKGVGEFDDFEEVVLEGAREGLWPMSETIAKLAADSDVGYKVLYHLATNTKDAARIDSLTPLEQAKAFGRLEAQLSSQQSDATADKDKGKDELSQKSAVKTSKAPPPVKSARGAGGSNQVSGDTNDFAAFEALAMQRSRRK